MVNYVNAAQRRENGMMEVGAEGVVGDVKKLIISINNNIFF